MKGPAILAAKLPSVLMRFVHYVCETMEHPEATKAFCADFSDFLDRLSDEDAFGTEGQNDPRGDQRR